VEEVLVVSRAELFAPPSAPFEGFHAGDGEGFLQTVGARGRFVPRDRAEPDPSLKQVIPYGLILYDGAAFLFWRSRKGGEERLHEKASLGVGGHVNPEDLPPGSAPGALRSAVERAFLRELREEVDIEDRFRTEVLGVLNDDSNHVGSVHFGIVYAVWATSARVRVREEDLLRGEFVPLASLGGYRPVLETWSAILLDQLPLLSAWR
jgi:predicted NUDIX family phosphoesterase